MQKIKDYPSFEENPKKIQGVRRVSYITKEEETLIENHSSGEIMKLSKLPREKFFLKDSFKYTKIFKDSIKDIINLSSKGLKLWGYIMYNLNTQTDTIIIYPDSCIEFCNYKSAKNIYPAIVELLEKEFIFRKAGSNTEYYINPNIIYNGRRKV